MLIFLLGYSTQKTTSENAKINASDYPDDEVGWFNAATTKVGEGDRSSWAMISYLHVPIMIIWVNTYCLYLSVGMVVLVLV